MYAYYQGHGFYGILLGRICNLLILAFLVGFSLFLLYCVDWNFIGRPATAASHPTLAAITKWSNLLRYHPHFKTWPKVAKLFRASWWMMLLGLGFIIVWSWQVVRTVQEIPSLLRMQRFYNQLLKVSDKQLLSTEFSDIVIKIVELQESHPISVDRLDAHDIALRIMRRENYLIALFNKDVFNVELPMLHLKPSLALTKTLEWNLSFCILNYVFDERCAIRKSFLKDVKRETLSEGLKRRFLIMGVINLVLAPAIFIFLLAYLILRYGEEVYRQPGTLGRRQYTTAARWRLREFNELPHYFERRLSHGHRKATKYMDQFAGGGRLAALARLVSFIAGSFAVVLLVVTVINEDLLMHFELSPGKSTIWYIGLFGTILAITRAMVIDLNQSHDPAKLMEAVVEYTHYLPKHWRGRLHTEVVRQEFGSLFDYKFRILFQELLGVLTTPFILLFSLPSCTDRLVEFFREFTVHVDGVGYVCSFALFNFERHGNKRYGGGGGSGGEAGGTTTIDKSQCTRQGKMEKSFLSFVANNPNWVPDQSGTRYLARLADFELSQSQSLRPADSMIGGSVVFRKPMRPAPPSTTTRRGMIIPEEESDEDPGPRNGIISILNQYYDSQRVVGT